ncbi:hypothetical protein BDW02DRAFT_542750 [Decorospora gaudefroyi]|uniref:Exonuclease domain-containing protein n=1 Tax=Decorospora gaudefroyi TaxID=184978 RepID=A0A6A5KPJ9_9PLEO|nr:hypothetical protein BDW02DRAFT_542750 [Decorospora gaudefroyi]
MPPVQGLQWIPFPPPPELYQGPLPSPLTLAHGDPSYAFELLDLLEPTYVMKKHGYLTQQLTDAELDEKRRCRYCNLTVAQLTKHLQRTLDHRHAHPIPSPPCQAYRPLPSMQTPLGNGYYDVHLCMVPCNFHPGSVNGATKCYDCCGQHVSESKPCATSEQHVLREYEAGKLHRMYQFHPTPPIYHESKENRHIRQAVAIDCEMGTAETGESELIRLSAIDYFTGEVLINNLVKTDQPLRHLNTRYSGVTWGQLNHALRNKRTLIGKAGARDALWRFVGPQTVIVGHGVNNDLRALRWIHTCVVDSYMVEHKIVQARKAFEAATEANMAMTTQQATQQLSVLAPPPATGHKTGSLTPHGQAPTTGLGEPKKQKKPKGCGDLALKTLLKKYLDRDIQMQGNKGHDSLEDAVAARDLVHWMVMRRLQQTYDGTMN